MWAEAKAALEGLLEACQYHFQQVWLEFSFSVLADIIRGKSAISWSIWHIVKSMREILKHIQVQITHIYRKDNQVADGLANWSIIYKCNEIFSSSADLSAILKRAAKLDRLRIPNIGCK